MASRAKWHRRQGSKENGFHYVDADGTRLLDKPTLERIKSLVIPPAWTDVLIAPSVASRVQVVGYDVAGRLQYLYHDKFQASQKRKKFSKLLTFAAQLPFLRKRAKRDLRRPELPKDKVLAVIIRLIDDLHFRVGSEKSVEQYKTFGITTLRNRHLEIKPNGEFIFNFVGKHHIRHKKIVADTVVAKVLRDLKSLKGSALFQYVTDEGTIKRITARDVNEYIKQSTDPSFTAKDFRTWGATLKAAVHLAQIGFVKGEKTIKKNIVRAVKFVAEQLGNTAAVSRNSYIHPDVIKKYEKGVTLEDFEAKPDAKPEAKMPGTDPDEDALIAMLKS